MNFRSIIWLDDKGIEEGDQHYMAYSQILIKTIKHFATDNELIVAQLVVKKCQEYANKRLAKK